MYAHGGESKTSEDKADCLAFISTGITAIDYSVPLLFSDNYYLLDALVISTPHHQFDLLVFTRRITWMVY